MIAAERRRQIESEGWTADHDDDEHDNHELATAAACYALPAFHSDREVGHGVSVHEILWPWEDEWWKPSEDRVRNLVKAGALIAAEIDRLLRQRAEALPAQSVQEAHPSQSPIVQVTDAAEASDIGNPMTPRTDLEMMSQTQRGVVYGNVVKADFARTLERELTQERSERLAFERGNMQLKQDVERLTKASVPICIGEPIIRLLAKDGQWMSKDGGGVIAADDLFRDDPYEKIAVLTSRLAEREAREAKDLAKLLSDKAMLLLERDSLKAELEEEKKHRQNFIKARDALSRLGQSQSPRAVTAEMMMKVLGWNVGKNTCQGYADAINAALQHPVEAVEPDTGDAEKAIQALYPGRTGQFTLEEVRKIWQTARGKNQPERKI